MQLSKIYHFALSVIYIFLKNPFSFLAKVNLKNLRVLFAALPREGMDEISKNLDSFVHDTVKEIPLINKAAIRKFLKSTNKAGRNRAKRILVISHEATRTGAPLLLFSMLKTLEQEMNVQSIVVLLKGGEMASRFFRHFPTYLLQHPPNAKRSWEEQNNLYKSLSPLKFDSIIVNSVESRSSIPMLAEQFNCQIISLVHEMGSYYEPKSWQPIEEHADKIIFPCFYIRDLAMTNTTFNPNKIHVFGQGLYNTAILDGNKEEARYDVRRELDLEDNALIALGCGSTIARKGIDIFSFIALSVLPTIDLISKPLYFIWLGDGNPNLVEKWVKRDLKQSDFTDKIRFIGVRKKPAKYFLASDLFIMTSRGDPYPSVVMEAMAAGLPIVGFENAGGYPEMLYPPNAYLHSYGDIRSASDSVERLVKNPILLTRHEQESINFVRENHSRKRYAQQIYDLITSKRTAFIEA